MNQRKRDYVLIGLFCSATLLEAPTAGADDFDCPPSRGAQIVDGNIIVVGSCTLGGTMVKGNVLLEADGDLLAEDATIIGNVQTDGAQRARVHFSNINGNIQLTGVDGASQSEVLDSMIGGTLDIYDNEARFVLEGNFVDSDLKANDNVGGVVIQDNDVGGNLQCQGNEPPPTGGNNTVDGNKEDQCENLQPGGTTTTSTTTTTLPSNGICGDHNGDGSIGATDALLVLQKSIGEEVDLVCPAQLR